MQAKLVRKVPDSYQGLPKEQDCQPHYTLKLHMLGLVVSVCRHLLTLLENSAQSYTWLFSVVWCGVVWCGVVWCGVVWCGVL